MTNTSFESIRIRPRAKVLPAHRKRESRKAARSAKRELPKWVTACRCLCYPPRVRPRVDEVKHPAAALGLRLPVLGSELRGSELLGFRCNGCGECCKRTRVALTHLDLERLARACGVSPGQLVDWLPAAAVDPTAEGDSLVELRGGESLMVLAHQQGACTLLARDNSCRAYEARPLDCRLFPWVLERGSRQNVERLSMFELEGLGRCGEQGQPAELGVLEREDAARWAELSLYRAQIARWNRLARRRRRFGHGVGGAEDFLAFVFEGRKIEGPSSR
jgi:Fe-S-cluster containining protein